MENIVLYGLGIDGEMFYWANKGKYNIEYCIDDNSQQSFHGRKVYQLKDVAAQDGGCWGGGILEANLL